MSYGRIQRQPARRPACPYERPRSAIRPSSSEAEESSSAPFWNRIFDSVKGLLSFSHHGDKEVAEKPVEIVDSPEAANDSIGIPAEPSSPALQWHGAPIDDISYGELRRICIEEGLRVSEDRDFMLNELQQHIVSQQNRRRPEGQNKRRLSNDDTSLEQIMMKKAKVGFSKDEFEKYMVLMKDNLKIADGDDIGKLSPGSFAPSDRSRELRRQSLPKRVPTPFAHLSNRRPSRRDSLSGPGAIGPIHLSFPSTVTSTEDIHDLSKSSKTARSILSSISSMSTPLIQTNEVLAKKRLQPRKPFNPYAQVGPPPSKLAFRMQPPIPKPSSDEPVKVSHKFGDDGVLKKRRQDDVNGLSLSPPISRPAPPVAQKLGVETSKSAPAISSSKSSFEPAKFTFPTPAAPKSAPGAVASVTSVPKSSPASAPVALAAPAAPAEEIVCPVCEMGMDDVDHSECKTGESSPSHQPSVAPLPEASGSAGFSFQLPKLSESAQKDSAPSFSFALPNPAETSTKFTFSALDAKDAGVPSQPAAPSSPPKFSFGVSARKNEPGSVEKTESKPASDALFKAPSTDFSFGSVEAVKTPSLESQIKKSATGVSTPSSAPAFSFNAPSTTAAPQPEITESKPAEQPKPFSFSSDAASLKFKATAEPAKSSEKLATSGSLGFNFGTPATTTTTAAPGIDLTKDTSSATSAPSTTEFKFDLKPKESAQGTSATDGTASSSAPFQFNAPSSQPAGGGFSFGSSAAAPPAATATSSTGFQFGSTATAPSTTSASTQPAFQFGSTTPAPSSAAPSSTPAFQFGSGSSTTPGLSSSTGFSFGTSEPSSAANPPSTPLKFGLTDTTPAPTPGLASSFVFGGSNMQTIQSSNAMEDSSAMSTNNVPATQAPAFTFGSNLSTPGAGFGQNPASTGSVFGQATPSTGPMFGQAALSAPGSGFSFGSDPNQPATSIDGFQSGGSFGFGQPPSTPSAPAFSFGSSATTTAPFPGAINFDAPVPENLGGSFSHGMAPQGRPMVKAKRVARKR